jgi:hypothetical protein
MVTGLRQPGRHRRVLAAGTAVLPRLARSSADAPLLEG